ncbi:MAG TPA: cobyric acid synthase [Clostridia bacterium]|nr:cobyric acid synthase [Clostridia bacterium]
MAYQREQHMAKTLMIQGVASGVGKSIVVAALCRILKQDGLRVSPFKAQNMTLNTVRIESSLEIAHAQFVQARAAGVEPSVEMNPVLIKPGGDMSSEILLMGRPVGTFHARDYKERSPVLFRSIAKALDDLRSRFDAVIIEGAGSPVELNLMEHEIVNMRVARYTGAPTLIVGDISKGGVFASLLGTIVLLPQTDRELVKGFIINKFRGDSESLKPGLERLEEMTGKKVLGVVPWLDGFGIPDEDVVSGSAVADKKRLTDPAISAEKIGLSDTTAGTEERCLSDQIPSVKKRSPADPMVNTVEVSESSLDRLAHVVRSSIDMGRIYDLLYAGGPGMQ